MLPDTSTSPAACGDWAIRRALWTACDLRSRWLRNSNPGGMILGLTYLTLKNWDEAEECFRHVLAIEPGSSRAVQQLAYVQQKKIARIRG